MQSLQEPCLHTADVHFLVLHEFALTIIAYSIGTEQVNAAK